MKNVDLMISGPQNTTLRARVILGKPSDLPQAIMQAAEAFLKAHGHGLAVPMVIHAEAKNGGSARLLTRRRRLMRGTIDLEQWRR